MAYSCPPSFSQGTSVLLSEDDFKSKFANWCTYGERFHPWPTGTILLFNIRIEHADTGNVEDRWINVINTNKHAEVEMIQILERKMKEPFIRVAPKLRIYLSYSPCSDCAGKLIDFKNRLEDEIEIQIRFGTFYRYYKLCNKEGLLNLLMDGVVLHIFNGEADWVRFLNDIGIPQGDQVQYLHHVRERKRKDREKIDQSMLDELYEKCALSVHDFEDKFANSCTYGKTSDPWPKGYCSTILFFNIRIEHVDIGNVEDKWIKVVNTDKHAEDKMIQILQCTMNQPNIRFGPILRIYLSYSPCSGCVYKLIDFFQKELGAEIKIQIRFGTFYRHYERCNKDGLVMLLKNGVVLDIFNGEADWVRFLNDIGIPQGEHERYLRHVRIEKRKDRERVDQDKLDNLYETKLTAELMEQCMKSLSIE